MFSLSLIENILDKRIGFVAEVLIIHTSETYISAH